MGRRFSSSHQEVVALAVAALVSASACDVFNDKLEARLDDERSGDGDGDGDGDAGSDAAVGSLFALGDLCSGTVPIVESSETPFKIGVAGLASSVAESGECSVSADVLSKADGFFQVKARAGQRWHFHLDAAPGQNLSVFTAESCDLRECVAAADVCGVNESEHFTFVAERAGNYVVIVDGIDPTAAPLGLLAISPECGDGKKVHGEVCDDGNRLTGDGCDDACRVELRGAAVEEVEPNDDTYLANVATSDLATPLLINGRIGGGACQPDHYLLRVPKAGVLNLKVRNGAGGACAGAPLLDLGLFLADHQELRENVSIAHQAGAGGGCPELTQALNPGTYFLRLSRLEAAAQFEYQIEVSLTVPAPGG